MGKKNAFSEHRFYLLVFICTIQNIQLLNTSPL